ncbi:tax1-binding protein 3-like [Glandiceps talaboti]
MVDPLEGIPCIVVEVIKEPRNGKIGLGFSIGGGIDQDPAKNPIAPNDNGIFVTNIQPGGPADRAGLQYGDKILEANGFDLTMATHKHAVKLLSKEREPRVVMKVTRPGLVPPQH